jgi:hypothetical protein
MELAPKKVGLCLWRMEKGHRIDGTFQPRPSPVDLARVLDTSTQQCTRSRGSSDIRLVVMLLPPGLSRAISPSVAIPTGTTAQRDISYCTTRGTVDGISTDCLSMCGITIPSHGRSRLVHASHPLSGGAEDDLTSSLLAEQTALGHRAKQSAA